MRNWIAAALFGGLFALTACQDYGRDEVVEEPARIEAEEAEEPREGPTRFEYDPELRWENRERELDYPGME